MNKNINNSTVCIAFAAAMLAIGIIASCNYISPTLAQQHRQQQNFIAKLSGTNELPPVKTKATGIAKFTLSPDGKSLAYVINVRNISDIVRAHIHSGKHGENGPVVATLLLNPSMAATPTGKTNGTTFTGNIVSSFLEGPLTGSQMADLINLIKNQGAYINIHTQRHQDGEIRGQILLSVVGNGAAAERSAVDNNTSNIQ